MKYLFIFSAVIMLALSPVFIMASDTDDAAYYGRIDIVNNGTAVTNGFVNLTLDSQVLIGDYYMWPNCTDSAIIGTTGADVAYMPAPNSTDTWLIWVPSIGENVTIQNTLFTGGNSPMLGDVRWFPGAGGAITSDASGIEMGDDFNLTMIGWFNTTNNGQNFVAKGTAFTAGYGAGSNITATVNEAVAHQSYTTGDDTNEPVGDEWGANDYDAAQSFTTTDSYIVDIVKIECAIAGVNTANSTLSIREMGATPTSNSALTTGSASMHVNGWVEFDVTDYTLSASTQYVIVFYNTVGDDNWREDGSSASYSGGSSWTNDNDAGWVEDTDDDFMFEIIATTPQVTATAVNSGEHAISFVADGTTFKSFVDYAEQDSVLLAGASVPDNGNVYQWAGNSTMPYVQYINLTVGGSTELIYDFTNFISDTTVIDTGDTPADDGTVTFQTQASDPDLSADLVSFLPYDLSEASATAVGAEAEMWDSAPDSIDQLYTEMNRNHLPGAGLIDDLLNNASIPLAVFWIPAAYGVSIVLGLGAYAMTRNLLVQAAVSAVVMGFHSFMTGGGIIPFWTVIVFVIEAIILVWTLRQRQVA